MTYYYKKLKIQFKEDGAASRLNAFMLSTQRKRAIKTLQSTQELADLFYLRVRSIKQYNFFARKNELSVVPWQFSVRNCIIVAESLVLTLSFVCKENTVNPFHVRSSRSYVFFKIGVLKNFPNFTREHLHWSLFLINLQA